MNYYDAYDNDIDDIKVLYCCVDHLIRRPSQYYDQALFLGCRQSVVKVRSGAIW